MKVKALCCLIMAIIVITGLSVFACGNAKVTTVTSGDGTMIKFKESTTKPLILADLNKKYTATIETEKGNLVLELFAKDVPKAVSNFVYLATTGYYDNCTFHRVIPGFMAQGGDPTGTGTGNPGYAFANEITKHKHVVGALSMANTGSSNSNGSQFFICYATVPSLDGDYRVFGQLTAGMDVLKSLTARDPDTNPKFQGTRIIKISIDVQ
jgi:cyclophilin family peptidyl-prolyl cis-trans isomerase